jgi:hypothetical protein
MANRLREMLAGEFGSQADNVAEFLCRPEVVQQMHLAIENLLIEFRESGIFVIHPANGFTVKSVEGEPNSIMRIGTRSGLEHIMKQFQERPRDVDNQD